MRFLKLCLNLSTATLVFFSPLPTHAADRSDYHVVPIIFNPVAEPRSWRELARDCMNNESCGEVVDSVGAYVGIPPGSIKATMDAADTLGLGPKSRQEGEQYWLEVPSPDGYFLCRAHLKVISIAPTDGRRSPTLEVSAGEHGAYVYAFVHTLGSTAGRSWIEALITVTYLPNNKRSDPDANGCFYRNGQRSHYRCKGGTCSANGNLGGTDDLYGLPPSENLWFLSSAGTEAFKALNTSASKVSDMKVGDFNGDGKADVLTTGGGEWNVSFGGAGRWTTINKSGTSIHDMKLGDFNGDGKTDVLTTGGGVWMVSYGGTGQWETLNQSGTVVRDMKIGDFNGDGKSDVLTTGGGEWNVSFGGSANWITINKSGTGIHEMKLGDFDGDGKTDVLSTGGGEWNVSFGGSSRWKTIKRSPVPIQDLQLGDFDGDGRTDILTVSGGRWMMSPGGSGDKQPLNQASTGGSDLLLGDFDGDRRTDVLISTSLLER